MKNDKLIPPMKAFCQQLKGKQVIDKRMKRKGLIESIEFHNKDFSICWFRFTWEEGAYLVSKKEIDLIENQSIQLKLFN